MANSQGKNIIIIVGSSLKRTGVEEDLNMIEKTFKDFYNGEVINCMDMTKTEYNKFFCDLKTDELWIEKFRQCNFLAVVCLFHGDTDGEIKFNGSVLLLKCYFLHPFFFIEQLNGKLKWLIVQACRGKLTSTDMMQADGQARQTYLDRYMISYCTTEGATSEQYDDKGKIFIQYLCKVLADNASKNYEMSLVTIMTKVNDMVRDYGITKHINDFTPPEYHKNFDDHFFGQ